MIATETDPKVAIRHPVVSQCLEAIEAARAAYQNNPNDSTRYQLVRAEQRLVGICRTLRIA